MKIYKLYGWARRVSRCPISAYLDAEDVWLTGKPVITQSRETVGFRVVLGGRVIESEMIGSRVFDFGRVDKEHWCVRAYVAGGYLYHLFTRQADARQHFDTMVKRYKSDSRWSLTTSSVT